MRHPMRLSPSSRSSARRFPCTRHSRAPAKDDPIIGIWQLNVAKSNYYPGPGPRQ